MFAHLTRQGPRPPVVRLSAAYFRAGHRLLDSLTRRLQQSLPPAQVRDTESQLPVPAGAGRP